MTSVRPKTFAVPDGTVLIGRARREVAMSNESWEEQFKQFLRKTGDDFRRAGEDIKAEAQKLFDAAMDPDEQQKVRDRLKELSSWARKRAEDVAGSMETAASKAARVFHCATNDVTETAEKGSRAPRTSSNSEPPGGDEKRGTAAAASSAHRKRGKAKRKKIKGKPPEKSGKPKR
jgi:hypothetical protein